jgi:hypothetical protein
MGNYLRLALPVMMALLCATLAWAQQDTPAPQTETVEAEAAPPDQEVEVNEDNYRQFMELKDDLRERTIVPEESFASRSGLQKLDNLPEESQKHLRNQLREIISRGERWQPGDENADYPYVPSEAALTSVSLQQQEAEAWGELLDNYHAREAQIYANSARTRAAVAASGAVPGQAGDPSADGDGRAGQAAQADQADASRPGSTADSFAPGAQNTGGEQSTDGVAQSAMDFLQSAGYQGGAAGREGAQQQAANTGQDTGQEQLAGQQSAAAASATQSGSAQAGTREAAEQASAGAEQSAMEYLQQARQQQGGPADTGSQQAGDGSDSGSAGGQQATGAEQEIVKLEAGESATDATASESDDPADEGVSQNALEYLAGEGTPAGDASQDTLSIKDLLNASGVAPGVGAVQEEPKEPPEDPPD